MHDADRRQGALAALAAYLCWGVFGLFFHALAAVPAVEILAHRITWSAVLTTALVLGLGKGPDLLAVFADRRRLAGLAGSAVCITINWGVYIWSVGHGHALDASIGYYVLPLVAVALGALLLKERLGRRQLAAIGLVLLGVLVLATGLSGVPWIVLVLAFSFGGYGLLRKLVPVEALTGLCVETLLLAVPAALYLLTRPSGGALMQGDLFTTLMLLVSGPVTTVPLVLFAYGARRLQLSTLGLMQYLNPTIQMAVAVGLLGEHFTRTHAVTFLCIWGGLMLYSLPQRRRAGS